MSPKQQITNRKLTHNIPKPLSQAQWLSEFCIRPQYIVITAAVLLIIAVIAWLRPREAGDLFIALAGGRDVMAGHLGKPDNWAFTTQGHIWLNQNWGADLIFYLIHLSWGPVGLLILKALLILGTAIFTILWVMRRGAPLAVAMSATAAFMISSCYYMELRPYLFTLMLIPLILWLLYQTLERPFLIWLLAALTLFWANLHGGFIYGLGMIWLWMLCLITPALFGDGIKGVKPYRQIVAGVLSATLLAGFANPFGLLNLTHPFLIATHKSWQLAITEWKPLWNDLRFDGVREFLAWIIIIAILWILRQFIFKTPTTPTANKKVMKEPEKPQLSLIIFETSLTLVSILMALQSRRFIPVALLIMTPVLGILLWWLIRQCRRQWLIALAGCLILVYGIFHLGYILRYYAPHNPILTKEDSFFDKMHFIGSNFPSGPARFVNDNHIKGNVLCDWVWEGFLHLYAPDLKMFIGNRAQQVYDEKLLKVQDEIIFGDSPQKNLHDHGINLLALPYIPLYQNLISKVTENGNWTFIYADGKNFLLADTGFPENSRLIARVLQNQVIYPDQATALMSRALCMLSQDAKSDRLQAARMLDAALRLSPSAYGYGVLTQIPMYDPEAASEVIKLLQTDLGWLETLNFHDYGGDEILQSRYITASALMNIYQNAGMKQQADIFQQAMQQAMNLHQKIQ